MQALSRRKGENHADLLSKVLLAISRLVASLPLDDAARADVQASPKELAGGYICLLMPAIVMALLSRPAYAEDLYGPVVASVGNLGLVIEGEAFAIDGGTITIRLQPIRLYGLQALEDDHPCSDGKPTQFLSKLIAGQIVTCLVQGKDQNQRPVAICSVGNTDLNEAMVLNGLALADTFSSQVYRRTEQTAKALGAGYHKPGRGCVPSWHPTTRVGAQ